MAKCARFAACVYVLCPSSNERNKSEAALGEEEKGEKKKARWIKTRL